MSIRPVDATRMLDDSIESNEDKDYNLITGLVQRIFRPNFTLLSFFDDENQLFKAVNCRNQHDTNQQPKNEKERNKFMLSLDESLDVKVADDFSFSMGVEVIDDAIYLNRHSFKLKELLDCEKASFLRYVGASIQIDERPIGILTLLYADGEGTLNELSVDDKLSLVDFANVIAGFVRNRRESEIRSQRERANVMLGMNQHLRTPVSIMVVSFIPSDDLFIYYFFCS